MQSSAVCIDSLHLVSHSMKSDGSPIVESSVFRSVLATGDKVNSFNDIN